MDPQSACEGFNARKEPLLKATDQQPGRSLHLLRFAGQPLIPYFAVIIQQRCELEFRLIFRQILYRDLLHFTFW